MSSRDDILARVRKNQPAAQPLPAVPTFDTDIGSPLERFKAAVLRMGGKFADPPADGDLDALIGRLFPDAKVICSATPEVAGNRPLSDARKPADLTTSTWASCARCTAWRRPDRCGSPKREFKVNALGFLAQHLVVLLDPARSWPTCITPIASARISTPGTACS